MLKIENYTKLVGYEIGDTGHSINKIEEAESQYRIYLKASKDTKAFRISLERNPMSMDDYELWYWSAGANNALYPKRTMLKKEHISKPEYFMNCIDVLIKDKQF